MSDLDDMTTERDIFREAAVRMRAERDNAVARAEAAKDALARAIKLSFETEAKARLWDGERAESFAQRDMDEAARVARDAERDPRYEIPEADADLWAAGAVFAESPRPRSDMGLIDRAIHRAMGRESAPARRRPKRRGRAVRT